MVVVRVQGLWCGGGGEGTRVMVWWRGYEDDGVEVRCVKEDGG